MMWCCSILPRSAVIADSQNSHHLPGMGNAPRFLHLLGEIIAGSDLQQDPCDGFGDSLGCVVGTAAGQGGCICPELLRLSWFLFRDAGYGSRLRARLGKGHGGGGGCCVGTCTTPINT